MLQTEMFDRIMAQHCSQVTHAGRDKTWAEVDRLYYGIMKNEVACLLPHFSNCEKRKAGKAKGKGPQTAIKATRLWERLQIYLIDYSHYAKVFTHILHICYHFSKYSIAVPLPNREASTAALYLGLKLGKFGIPEIL